MDHSVFYDTRSAVICGMLFSTIVAMTADVPAAVPDIFLHLWHRYRLYQHVRKCRKPTGTAGESFWEIDMTKFEP